MNAREGGKRPDILQEGILGRACRADGSPIIVDDKFHAVSLLQSKPIPNLERDSDLTLAADCAGACHLYLLHSSKDIVLYSETDVLFGGRARAHVGVRRLAAAFQSCCNLTR